MRGGLAASLVWVAAIVWSIFLVASELNGGGGFFAVAIQLMGSAGILYALFLVTRPKKNGVLEILGVFREEVVPEATGMPKAPSGTGARAAIISITVALAIGGLLYRLSQDSGLHQSSAFFIGVPAVLAITLALTPKANSATGMILKGLTLALLLSGVVFYEGFICVVMAAPLFYLVGILVGIPIDRARRRKRSEGRVYSIVGVGLLLLSLEGAMPATSFPQQEAVAVTRTVDLGPAAFRRALARPPVFDETLPLYLRLGFPRPVSAYGAGLDVGDRRTIVFGNESPMEPMGDSHLHHEAPPETGGLLELKIVRSRPGAVVFEPVVDATAFTHWIAWGRSVVEWAPAAGGETRVTWTLEFRRKLSPSWYFGPFQRYAGEKAVGYLIDTVATP